MPQEIVFMAWQNINSGHSVMLPLNLPLPMPLARVIASLIMVSVMHSIQAVNQINGAKISVNQSSQDFSSQPVKNFNCQTNKFN